MRLRPADQPLRACRLIPVDARRKVNTALKGLPGGEHEHVVAVRLGERGHPQPGSARHLAPAAHEEGIIMATKKRRVHKRSYPQIVQIETVFSSYALLFRDATSCRSRRRENNARKGQKTASTAAENSRMGIFTTRATGANQRMSLGLRS